MAIGLHYGTFQCLPSSECAMAIFFGINPWMNAYINSRWIRWNILLSSFFLFKYIFTVHIKCKCSHESKSPFRQGLAHPLLILAAMSQSDPSPPPAPSPSKMSVETQVIVLDSAQLFTKTWIVVFMQVLGWFCSPRSLRLLCCFLSMDLANTLNATIMYFPSLPSME